MRIAFSGGGGSRHCSSSFASPVPAPPGRIWPRNGTGCQSSATSPAIADTLSQPAWSMLQMKAWASSQSSFTQFVVLGLHAGQVPRPSSPAWVTYQSSKFGHV